MVLNPLNPAAGDVPIPEDPREVEAALRAGPITHRIFPYICWRYGDRGRKFTQSDSAWLAWLVRHEQSRVKEHVLWLRSVLSNRGMPSWILEIHLLNLHEQLVRSLPEKRSHYEKLVAASNHLRQQRHEVMADQDWERLANDFAFMVEKQPTSAVLGIGRLLVASVIDERQGMINSVDSFQVWIADVKQWRQLSEMRQTLSSSFQEKLDSDSFISEWQNSLQNAIDKARKACNRSSVDAK